MRWGLLLIGGLLTGCVERGLQGIAADTRVEPADVDATTWVGFPIERTVFVTRASRAAATVEVAVPPGLTLLGGSVLEVGGGDTAKIRVRVEAKTVGRLTGAVQLAIDGAVHEVPVTGEIKAVPACDDPGPCQTARFDAVTGACRVDARPDGAACGDVCLENASCVAGTCVGTAARCDDGNACTADACGPDGCAHAPVVCAASNDPCKVASCDPVRGCVLDDVADGTACGSNDCTTAHVCMAGVCQVMTSPEGSVCRDATPCASEGRCTAQTCVSAPKRLASAWEILDTTKTKHTLLGVVSPAGLIYGIARNDAGIQIVAWDGGGFERWRSPIYPEYWSTQALYDADRGQLVLASKAWARALDGATGAQRWAIDLDAEMPLTNGGTAGVKQVYALKLTVLPKAKRVVAAYSEGNESHVAWIFGLDAATGAQAFKIRRDGHLYGLMTTDGDELFVGTAGCWQPASWNAVYSASGTQAWSVYQSGLPAISSGPQVWFQPYNAPTKFVGRIDLTTGSMSQEAAMGNDQPVLANGRTLYLKNASTGTTLTAWDAMAHTAAWTATGFPMSQLFLTEGGGVLGVSSTGVGHVDAAGALQWTCSVAAATINTTGASLTGGKLLLQTATGIGAFPVGGLEVSANGWSVSDRGNPQRTQRAR